MSFITQQLGLLGRCISPSFPNFFVTHFHSFKHLVYVVLEQVSKLWSSYIIMSPIFYQVLLPNDGSLQEFRRPVYKFQPPKCLFDYVALVYICIMSRYVNVPIILWAIGTIPQGKEGNIPKQRKTLTEPSLRLFAHLQTLSFLQGQYFGSFIKQQLRELGKRSIET